MALSEYMPYGAPELLDGANSRLARSTLIAALAVALMFAALGAIATNGSRTITIEAQDLRGVKFLPPLAEPPPDYRTQTPVAPAPPRPQEFAQPVPVPDPVAPTDDRLASPPLPSVPGGEGTRDGLSPTSPGIPTAPEKDPEPGAFVSVDELPNPVHCAEARYPDFAREAGVEGTVRVLMLVGLNGHVERAIIVPGGSVPMLDEAALAASRQCVYTPALSNNHPVKVWISRNYRFTLH